MSGLEQPSSPLGATLKQLNLIEDRVVRHEHGLSQTNMLPVNSGWASQSHDSSLHQLTVGAARQLQAKCGARD